MQLGLWNDFLSYRWGGVLVIQPALRKKCLIKRKMFTDWGFIFIKTDVRMRVWRCARFSQTDGREENMNSEITIWWKPHENIRSPVPKLSENKNIMIYWTLFLWGESNYSFLSWFFAWITHKSQSFSKSLVCLSRINVSMNMSVSQNDKSCHCVRIRQSNCFVVLPI